jgi:hypothetical protein
MGGELSAESAVDRRTGCLFCGNADARFSSEEHVVALALGNSVESGLVSTELVIPPGEVCDKCNRRRLSLRDKALTGWPPISVFRSLGQIRNRRGRLVDAVAGTQWHLKLDVDDPRVFELWAITSTDETSGRDEVARALCKVAVEMRWLEDPVDARSERWNPIAAAAIGGPLPPGLTLGLRQPDSIASIDLTPGAEVLVDPQTARLRMVCQLWVVGLRLLLLLNTPAPPLPNTAWWEVDPETGALSGPESMWASFAGQAARATRVDLERDESQLREGLWLPTRDEGTHLSLHPAEPDTPSSR